MLRLLDDDESEINADEREERALDGKCANERGDYCLWSRRTGA